MRDPFQAIELLQIHPIGGDRRLAFEELCCQLAAIEPDSSRTSFSRKGSGADAGVECFSVHLDKTETCWQAKFFQSLGSSQIGQLNESIEQALLKHPNLTKYIVCLPINLKDSRLTPQSKTDLERWTEWRAKHLAVASKAGRTLQIELWDSTAILGRLTNNDPGAAGRMAFFLGRLSLTQEWFRAKFGLTQAALQDRYMPQYDVTLPIEKAFWGLSRSSDLQSRAFVWTGRLSSRWHSIGKTESVVPAHLWAPTEAAFRRLSTELSAKVSASEPHPAAAWCRLAEVLSDAVQGCVQACYAAASTGHEDAYSTRLRLHELADVVNDIIEELDSESFRFVNDNALLVVGPAGAGKSHLLADVADEAIGSGRPAIMLLTSSFVDGEPGPQILAQLDIQGYSFEEFLGAFDAAGEAAGVRSLLLIDALNERNGLALWRDRLSRFCMEASRFKNVAICFSCRSTYLPLLFPSTQQAPFTLPQIEHLGFSAEGGRATRQYLAQRGIAPIGGPTSLTELGNPLFLKVCCDALKSQGLTAFPAGSRSLTGLFDIYVKSIYRSLEQRMGLEVRLHVPFRAVQALTTLMREVGSGYLPIEDALAAVEAVHRSRNRRDQNLIFQLEDEGLLAIEPVLDGGDGDESKEMVRFTFERISDLLLAEALLDRHASAKASVAKPPPGSPLREFLTSTDLYMHAGVSEALAILLPERHGIEILDIDCESENDSSCELNRPFTESLLLRDQRFFTDRTRELLADRFTSSECFQILFTVATEPDNKFNAEGIHAQLWSMTMPSRDASWSYELARAGADEEGPFQSLIEWAWDCGADEAIEETRAELAAVALTWMFTTSHRGIRDRATKALTSLLRPRLGLARSLLARFVEVNDPYVLERLLASVYGAVLHSIDDCKIAATAELVHELFFKAGAPPAYFLIRDYASGILALQRAKSATGAGTNSALANPPWVSDLTLRHIDKKELEPNKVEHRKIEEPIDDQITKSSSSEWTGDFAKYVIASSVHHWLATPINAAAPRTAAEACAIWTLSLNAIDDAPLLQALGRIYAFVTRRSSVDAAPNGRSREMERIVIRLTPAESDPDVRARDEAEFAELELAVLAQLDSPGKLIYALFIKPYLGSVRHGSRSDLPAQLPNQLGQLWVAVRAHELGWTKELLGAVDDELGNRSSRQVHAVERVGKKYQWIALHELLARLSDNLMFSSRYGDFDGPFKGAWQTSRRDIDPSLSIKRTHEDDGHGPVWWSPVSANLAAIATDEQATWVRTDDDLLNSASQLDVTDPDGRHWLVLHSFTNFSTATSSGSHVDTWCRIWCMVARNADAAKLVSAFSRAQLIDPSALPERNITEIFLWEYPWHPSLDAGDAWRQPLYRHEGQLPDVLPASASYLCESGGYDHSIENSVRIQLPERWLMKTMDLRLSDTNGFGAVDRSGRLTFQDPSVSTRGPGAALIAKDEFLSMLEREGLCAIYVVAGEKGAYGGKTGEFVGRHVHTAVYTIDATGTVKLATRKIRME